VEIEIKLSNLHPGQQKVRDEAKRFNVLCCGRRWGKSELATDILCDTALDGFPLGYFTPTYKLLDGTYRECVSILDPLITRKNEHNFIEVKGGGKIDFWSLENELAGEIKKWLRVRKVVTKYSPISKTESKNKKINKLVQSADGKLTGLSYAIATNIKKKGIKPTYFFSGKSYSAVEATKKEQKKRFAKAFKLDIIENLKSN